MYCFATPGLSDCTKHPVTETVLESLFVSPLRVLEIGTGSGYQAAILSRLVRELYSIEIVPELARSAAETLSRLGFRNVAVLEGDGYLGLPEKAPFDRIILPPGVNSFTSFSGISGGAAAGWSHQSALGSRPSLSC